MVIVPFSETCPEVVLSKLMSIHSLSVIYCALPVIWSILDGMPNVLNAAIMKISLERESALRMRSVPAGVACKFLAFSSLATVIFFFVQEMILSANAAAPSGVVTSFASSLPYI